MFTSSSTTQPRQVQYIQVEGLTLGNVSTSASGQSVSGKTLTVGQSGSQIRVLQAISKGGSHIPRNVNVGNSQQIPVQIVKQGTGNHMVIQSMVPVSSIKTPLASPGKVVKIPGARVVTKSPGGVSKLKVGDTIVIPKALNTINTASINGNSPVIISQHMNSPTPTKFIQAGSPISYRTTNSSGTQEITYIQQPTTLNTINSSKTCPTWTVSPMRCKRPNEMTDGGDIKRRRTPTGHEKGSKGLRHFAMLVCEKVKHKRTTTYNEVADELVTEYAATQRHNSDQQYDQKNIRRRVYDALNVLMAMNIIYKDKKDIHWVGLPTNSAHEKEQLENDKQTKLQTIKDKKLQLQELILQQIAFKNLVQRNKRLLQTQGSPASNSSIQLPFIIVNTSKKTVIDCSISNDKYEYLFNFDNTFEIHDDIEVLKRMGMAYGLENGRCTAENLQTAISLVPPVLKPYVEEMAGCSSRKPVSLQGATVQPAIKKEINSHDMALQSNSLFLSSYHDNGTDVDDILMHSDTQTSGSALSSGSSLTLNGLSSQSSPADSQEV